MKKLVKNSFKVLDTNITELKDPTYECMNELKERLEKERDS